jgi:hypothetical protein
MVIRTTAAMPATVKIAVFFRIMATDKVIEYRRSSASAGAKLGVKSRSRRRV